MLTRLFYFVLFYIDAIADIALLADQVIYTFLDQIFHSTPAHRLHLKQTQALLAARTVSFLLPYLPHFPLLAIQLITLHPSFLLHTSLLFVLCLICYIDLRYLCIPDIFHLIFLLLFLYVQSYQTIAFGERFIGACVISIPLLVLYLATHAIGLGDVKLMASAGFLLGYPQIALAFYLASFFGGFYASFFILTNKANRHSIVPFAPPLCAGIYLSYLFGDSLLHWLLQ